MLPMTLMGVLLPMTPMDYVPLGSGKCDDNLSDDFDKGC